MKEHTETKTRPRPRTGGFAGGSGAPPCLLVAAGPPGVTTVDRCEIQPSFMIGRSSSCSLPLADDGASKHHLLIHHRDGQSWIEDLQSTNGTFVGGKRLEVKEKLHSPEVIRICDTVLVFHADATLLSEPPPMNVHGLAGEFHTGPLLREVEAALLSSRHLLLGGPSGSGKEMIARAVFEIIGETRNQLPVIAHNAALFSSEEQVTTTLFGVAPRVFSNVDARPGLIEQAQGGVLFLDEVHNLSERVQRSLLRIIEDGKFSRIGETEERKIDVRFVLASNAPAPSYSLAHDLLARLRVVRIPALTERVADIPCLFDHLLETSLKRFNLSLSSVKPLLLGEHYEALCLDGFSGDNVRGISDLADRIATYVAAGRTPTEAVATVFADRFADRPAARCDTVAQPAQTEKARPSKFDKHKKQIVDTFYGCEECLKATVKYLEEQGISCSESSLRNVIDKWEIPRKTNKIKK